MSWHYSRALVGEFLADPCWDGVPCAPLKTTNTPDLYSSHGKTTDALNRSRSGMTCEPLTDDLGADLLTWFQAGFRVRTFLQLARVPVFRAKNRDCGKKWRVSFAKWSPDSSLWKTRQFLLTGGWATFLAIWPQWGLMQDGACWEHITPGRLTNGIESGFWPTPTQRPGRPCEGNVRLYRAKILAGEMTEGEGMAILGGKSPLDAHCTVKKWPTPPKPGGEPIGGKLNPAWVAWLMGWPIGWTDLRPLEMDKFQRWRRSHGRS